MSLSEKYPNISDVLTVLDAEFPERFPKRFNLDEIESEIIRAKSAMSESEFSEFVDGDESEQKKLTKKYALKNLNSFLNWAFENL